MFVILRKKGAGGPPFSRADTFVGKSFAGFGQFSVKDLVAGNAVFSGGPLKHNAFSIKTPIGFGIVAAKGQLLYVAEVCFFRIVKGIGC